MSRLSEAYSRTALSALPFLAAGRASVEREIPSKSLLEELRSFKDL